MSHARATALMTKTSPVTRSPDARWGKTFSRQSFRLVISEQGTVLPSGTSALIRRSNQRIRRAQLDGVVQGAVERTTHRVQAMHPLHRFADLFRGLEPQGHMDAPDHQHSLVFFHFADDVGGEASFAGIDLARL